MPVDIHDLELGTGALAGGFVDPARHGLNLAVPDACCQRLVALTDRGRRAGASSEEIARQALQKDFGGWSESHRLVADVDMIRREQEGNRSRRDPLDVMAMARLDRRPK
jgi:hypothetical protein